MSGHTLKKLCTAIVILLLFMSSPAQPASESADQPGLVELNGTPGQHPLTAGLNSVCIRYNSLNSLIRDGKIDKGSARKELKQLLTALQREYVRAAGKYYPRTDWVFPLAGYNSRAVSGGRSKGFVARGYDFFTGNRHGGHPAFDIFIRDRNQDSLDDRTNSPVTVLSLTGGIVVALEKEWNQGSGLRGGKYLWIYDPANDLLVYYAHNSELLKGLGDMVRPGDPLATVGRSGLNASKRRSPTHLHLSVLKVSDGWPQPLDVYQDLAHARAMAASQPGSGMGESIDYNR